MTIKDYQDIAIKILALLIFLGFLAFTITVIYIYDKNKKEIITSCTDGCNTYSVELKEMNLYGDTTQPLLEKINQLDSPTGGGKLCVLNNQFLHEKDKLNNPNKCELGIHIKNTRNCDIERIVGKKKAEKVNILSQITGLEGVLFKFPIDTSEEDMKRCTKKFIQNNRNLFFKEDKKLKKSK